MALKPRLGDGLCVPVYRRRDDWADHNHLGDSHWFSRTDLDEPARTWAELTELGDIAYVGQFVDRSGRTETADPLRG